MEAIILRLDFGEQSGEARRYVRDNPKVRLGDFLKVYPARSDKALPVGYLELPLERFAVQPVRLLQPSAPETSVPAAAPAPRVGGLLRAELDAAWEEAAQPVKPAAESLDHYPESISDHEAVRLAYGEELRSIGDFLRHGLSVLVVCDKLLTEFIYEYVCGLAGKKPVLENALSEDNRGRMGLAGQMEQAMQGGPANPLGMLPLVIRNLKQGEVLILRGVDLLDTPAQIELLYQRTGKGEKAQLLGFLDPSLEVQKVLSDRFAVHIHLTGLPRHVGETGKPQEYTVGRLLTRTERARFSDYDPEGLYKNVAGLNAIQFRNAMQYVGATVAPGCDTAAIYRVIRQFKRSSNDEIEIPDTSFEQIGGYEDVKHQLQRTIRLMGGQIEGLSDAARAQLIPRGFIFHGPPGTGKTLFAKAVANEMNATIQMVSGPEIMDKYVGQSENNLRRIFSVARRNAPAVVFFDEFDSIASQRSTYADGGARANNAVVAQLLTEMDGFRQEQAVLVIGTTNRIDIIDEALLRPSRLRPIEIGLPDYPARQQVAGIHARNFCVDRLLTELWQRQAEPAWGKDAAGFVTRVLEQVAEATEGFNNDELRAIFQEASMEYYLDGQAVTPEYLAQKVEAVRRRREERRSQHLRR